MAHFDAYGRPLRGDSGPEYGYETYKTYDFNDPNRHMPTYSNPSTSTRYAPESRDLPYASQSASSARPLSPQQSYSSNNNMGTAYGSDRGSAVDSDSVSPDIIAAITEKVKRELFEHLKQTGTIDDQPRASYMQREFSEKSNSTNQSPPPDNRRVYTPPSPSSTTKQSFSTPPTEPMRSPPLSPSLDKSSRFNDRDRDRDRDRGYNDRPAQKVHRTYSTLELSTIDHKWGRLFDNESRPTERLGQFLRGLANHIVDDFAPKKSIVITPSKMAAYYSAYPIGKEIHPYVSVFKTLSNAQISKLYQDLGCQHHLVQEDFHSYPTIPALTPLGFAHWMTIQISAYPSEESERLGKVVLALPINADGQMVDGKPERLPKQISRHLLPDVGDRDSEKLMRTAISNFSDELGIPQSSRNKPRTSSPPPRQSTPADRSKSRPDDIPQPRASYAGLTGKSIERERMPYAGAPSVTSESSSVDEGSAVQIERERKPYSAQPGNGKIYTGPNNVNTSNRPGRANSTSRVKEPQERERSRSRHDRTQSNASQDNYKPPPLSSTKRNRSPQFKSYSQSTPTNIDVGSTYVPSPANFPPTFETSSYGSNASFPPPPSSSEIHSSRDRRRDERSHRRGVEDDRFSSSTHINDFSSPRDAEKWDRLHEGLDSRSSDYDRDRPTKSTGSAYSEHMTRSSYMEPQVGADYEDWYRNGVDKSMRNSMYY
ncbi:28b041ef-dfbf-48f0-8e2b-1840cb53fe90 [Sclerotinia trifoliorum]|uniref:28b041ef-dfbf-48f0-8e2b-1840cb53fe90 n=1 Tax=Sclerotinia trifoliorum TaxID=28548 RepID=A0A8H2VQM5_9HELO|nr:28b041ef-dfbf-48f0-8e2b-1840cb53fe90 [Sclerotinia trifoliorum]